MDEEDLRVLKQIKYAIRKTLEKYEKKWVKWHGHKKKSGLKTKNITSVQFVPMIGEVAKAVFN